jgi:hypothetical protein
MIKLSFFKAVGIIIIFILVAATISEVLIPKLDQLAYAHTFTGDESASFLAVIKMLQAESTLIKTNFALNPALAQQHAKAVVSIINRNYTFGVLPDEVSENNKRVAYDITKGANALQIAVNAKPSPTQAADVDTKINYLNGVLQEAVTARIPKEYINNSTINAQATKDLVNEALRQYGYAFGISKAENAAAANHASVSNVSALQSAQAFFSQSQSMLKDIKSLLTSESSAASSSLISKVTTDLTQLKNSIDASLVGGALVPYDTVANLVLNTISPDLDIAFHLK